MPRHFRKAVGKSGGTKPMKTTKKKGNPHGKGKKEVSPRRGRHR